MLIKNECYISVNFFFLLKVEKLLGNFLLQFLMLVIKINFFINFLLKNLSWRKQLIQKVSKYFEKITMWVLQF